MIDLVVIQTGPFTSVQDTGRVGAQRYGLPPSGAMDPLALASANAPVGNAAGTAAIEVGPMKTVFRVEGGPARIALAGAMRAIDVSGQAVAANRSIAVQDGATIALDVARDGVFSYLAVAGGLAGEPSFGSFSVTAGADIGSPLPRPLQAGDRLKLAAAPFGPELCIDQVVRDDGPIRIVRGPQADEFDDAYDAFLNAQWDITPAANRMGYRLKGPKIAHSRGHNIVSDGTVNGSIQIPGDGQPIVLMPDRGTTGGYPKIATVITSDLGRLAQMTAGRRLRFEAVSIADAQALARDFYRLIAALPSRVRPAEDTSDALQALSAANLAGSAVNALDARSWQADATEQTS